MGAMPTAPPGHVLTTAAPYSFAMRRTHFWLLSAFVVLLLLAGNRCVFAADSPQPSSPKPNMLTPDEIADGWILLFDGETQFGWAAGSEADWKVADGVISVT